MIRKTRPSFGVRASPRCRTPPRLARLLLLWLLSFVPIHTPSAHRQTAGSETPATTLRTLSGATTRDAQDSAARSLAAEADRLRADWVEASLRSAIEKYTGASLLWRSAGDARSAAGALAEAAGVHFVLGEYRQALSLYRKVAAESRLAGDRQREAEALCQAGRLYSYLGDNDAALKHLKRGLAYYSLPGIEQTSQLRRSHAEALSQMGEVYYSKGDLFKSSEHLSRALELFAEVGDGGGEARARLFSGYVAATIGESEKATGQFNQALALYRAAADRSGEALSLTALGISHSLKREEEEAVNLHREAMHIFGVIGDRQSEAITLNGVGQAYQNLHEYDLALENYEQALKLFQTNGSLDFASVTVYQIAGVCRAKGESEQALAYYNRCAKLSRAAKKRRMEAYAMNEIAAIYASQGKRRQTLGQYQKIERFYAAVHDARGQALTLNNMGDFFLSLGDTAQALVSYRRALPLSRRAGERGVEVSTLYNLARAARDAGDIEEAISEVEQSIGIVESLRANIASPDFRSSYFSGVRRHYELYVELLMEMERRQPGHGYAAAALGVSESARARALLELLAEVGTDIRQGVDPSVLERVREVQQLLKAQEQYQLELSSGGRAGDESEEVARGIDRLRAEYQALQAQLREQNPRHAALTQPKSLNLEEIQAELSDGDTLLLEYMLGSEKSYLWAVTRDSLSSYELPPRAVLEGTARDLYKSLVARQVVEGQVDAGYQDRVEQSDRAYDEQARVLSRELLGPVAGQLENKRLLVVTEGVLQYIPFDALPVPSVQTKQASDVAENSSEEIRLLVSQHEVISLPSISTLAGIRRERPRASTAGDVVAVLADPVFNRHDERLQGGEDSRARDATQEPDAGLTLRALRDFEGITGSSGGGFMRLTHTSEEADAIVAAAPRGTGMVAKGFDASRETATGARIGHSRIVHFATHGFINSEHPELSGIVLSMVNRDGGREDGFLDLQDIYSLNLSADLVVLSACETGLGKDVKGEGLVGLTRGFMYAGSKSVVASLWKVDDRATAELMGHFYEAMLREGLPPAAALRSAKEAVRQQKRWRAPYFWAAFVLQGEYKDGIKMRRADWTASGVAVVLSLILIAVGSVVFMRRRRAPLLR
jgi:CHAT domain-containing protein/Tfp pilus assembly protein PilF